MPVVKGYKQCVALPDNRYTETRNITARAKPLARQDIILAFLLDFYDSLAKLRFTVCFYTRYICLMALLSQSLY